MMRKQHFIIAIIICISLISCVKKVESEGIVYSKNGTALPNVTVFLSVYTSGKDAPTGNAYSTTTDANGHFMFSKNISKDCSFGLGCDFNGEFFHSDHLSRETIKHYDIHLH